MRNYYNVVTTSHIENRNFRSIFYQCYSVAVTGTVRTLSVSLSYHSGPATHTTPAGRVLDGVRDQTQWSAPLAFSCTGPGLVPVLPARCHSSAGAS